MRVVAYEARFAFTTGGAKPGRSAYIYKFPLMAGFAQSEAGVRKYASFCTSRGMLPVGCGTATERCDESVFEAGLGAACLAMPASYLCYINVEGQSGGHIRALAGWSQTLVATAAIYSGGGVTGTCKYSGGGQGIYCVYLSSSDLSNENQKALTTSMRMHPVCGALVSNGAVAYARTHARTHTHDLLTS